MTIKVLTGTYSLGYGFSAPITTLSIASTGYVGGNGVFSGGVAAYTVINDGSVKAQGVNQNAVALNDGGVLVNGGASDAKAFLLGGESGVSVLRAAASIANFGSILSTATGTAQRFAAGIYLHAGGQVTNGAAADTTAMIAGGNGVMDIGAGTVTNYATISGAYGRGVSITEAATVINGTTADTHAYISGGTGVEIDGGGVIRNLGTIAGSANTGDDGVALSVNGGTIVNGAANDLSALIEGDAGVFLAGPACTLFNYGTIRSSNADQGAYLQGAGTLFNGSLADKTALIQGVIGVEVGAAAETTLLNLGTVLATGAGYQDSAFWGQGGPTRVTNGAAADSTALMSGYQGVISAGPATVTNFGTIAATGSGKDAIDLKDGGTLTVERGSSIIGTIASVGGVLSLAAGATMSSAGFDGFSHLIVGQGATFTLTGTGGIGGGADMRTVSGAGVLSLTGGASQWASGAALSVGGIAISGAATTVSVTTNLIYAGAWRQTAGSVSVQVVDQLTLSGPDDLVEGSLVGAGTVILSGAGDRLISLTTGHLMRITASNASMAGTLTINGALDINCPDLVLTGAVVLTGGGAVALSNSTSNMITGASSAITLRNEDDTLEGSGRIGAGSIRLVNAAGGEIIANQSAGMTIDTGANSVINAGMIEAVGSSQLTIASVIANSGTLAALGGDLTVLGAVTGAGGVRISAGTASFASNFSENVAFGASGELKLAHSTVYKGSITNFSKTGTTSLDLEDIDFATAAAAYSGTKTSGVLTVTDGAHTAKIEVVGNYLASVWLLSNDGSGGTLVVDPTAGGSGPSSAVSLVHAIGAFPPVGAVSEMAVGTRPIPRLPTLHALA